MRSHSRGALALGACAIALSATTASAQTFVDGFDTYPLGPIEGNTTASGAVWHGWGGTNTNIHQVVTTQASSVPNSVELIMGGDTVIDFDDMTGGNPMTAGQWRMTCEMYVTGDFDGRTYFIGMNEYTDPGPYEWAIQVAMDAGIGTTGVMQMQCDCGTAGSVTAPLVVDRWVELRWDIDFTADNVDYYYDGILMASYTWSAGVFGGDAYTVLSLNALDLFPETAPTAGQVYIDNLQVLDITVPPEPGVGFCFGDGTGTACPCGNNNDGSVPGSGCANGAFASGAKLGGSGVASLSADTLVLSATGLDPSNSGLYFQANNDLTPGLVWGDGLQCAGGQLKRLGVRFSSAAGASDTSAWATPISVKAGNILAGDTKRYQLWYRDNSGGQPCGVGVNDFNATNGYAVTWGA